jgi:hypothetical protein
MASMGMFQQRAETEFLIKKEIPALDIHIHDISKPHIKYLYGEKQRKKPVDSSDRTNM